MSQRELIIGKLITSGPTNITDLATEVARDTGIGFQSALADIWEVIGEGFADYDSSALVTLAGTACAPNSTGARRG